MDMTTLAKTNSFIQFTTYSMIVAVDSEGGIGFDNSLPWPKCPEDMQWFRNNTMGKIIIMGRKTFESIGSKPLPGRINIVIGTELNKEEARNFNVAHEGQEKAGYLIFVNTVGQAKEIISQTAGTLHKGGEVMIIGGGAIYEAFWPEVSRVYLTTFDGTYKTDIKINMDLSSFDLVYRDARRVMLPKFEIWDARSTFSVVRPDSNRFA